MRPPIGSGPYVVGEVDAGQERHAQAQSRTTGAAICRSTAACGISTRSASTIYRDANSHFEAFKKGLYDVRTETDPGRWQTGYDFPAVRDGRVVKETFTTGLPKGMLRLRLQHAPADLRRHPRARGDRAAVRFRVGQPQFLLRPLPAHARATSRAPSCRRTAVRPTRASARCSRRFPTRCAPTCIDGTWAPPVDRRLRPRPQRPARARSRCSPPPATSLRAPMLRNRSSGKPFTLRDPGHDQRRGAARARRSRAISSAPASRARAAGRRRAIRPAPHHLRFRHDPESLGPVALARQRASVLLGLGRRRRTRHAATTWA